MSYWDKFGGLSCSSAKFTSFRSCIHSLYSWTLPKSGIFVDPKICSNFIFTLILSSILNLDYMYYFRSTHPSIFHFHYFVNYFLFYFILFLFLFIYFICYYYIILYYTILYYIILYINIYLFIIYYFFFLLTSWFERIPKFLIICDITIDSIWLCLRLRWII